MRGIVCLHRGILTPLLKTGVFIGYFHHGMVVHSDVFTTFFLLEVLWFVQLLYDREWRTTVFVRPWLRHTHTKTHHHGRHRPHPLPPSMAVHRWFRRNVRALHVVANVGHARFIFFSPGGVSSVTFFTSARESNFFPNTGDVRHRLCRRPSLSVPQLGTTCVLAILWGTLGTRNSLKLTLWGLLRATKCAPSEKKIEWQGWDHRWPPFFLNQTTTNQKMEFVVGDYWGGRAAVVDGVRGGVLACLGRQYRRWKNKKNTIRHGLRWPPNDDKHNNQPNVRGRNERGKRYNKWEPGGARGKGDTIILGRSN